MAERGIWARIFNEYDYSMEDIIEMDDASFQQLVNFFLDLGCSPDKEAPPDFLKVINRKQPSQYRNKSNLDKNSQSLKPGSLQYSFNFSSQDSYEQSASSLIQQDQDEQYVVMLSKMQQLEKDSQLRKAEEERKIQEEIALQRSKLDAAKKKILEKAHKIPQEPDTTSSDPNSADKISITVVLPGGRRVLRRFASSELAEDVYSWIACFEELFDPIDESLVVSNESNSDNKTENQKEKESKNNDDDPNKKEKFLIDFEKKIENLGMPRDFQLIQPPQAIIDESKTLAEQKIGKRAFFNVILDD